jgi:malate/lactate dehydrogenase
VLSGEYGLEDVSLSVPVRLGNGGARGVEEWPLSGEERDALAEAARFVREAADGLA